MGERCSLIGKESFDSSAVVAQGVDRCVRGAGGHSALLTALLWGGSVGYRADRKIVSSTNIAHGVSHDNLFLPHTHLPSEL